MTGERHVVAFEGSADRVQRARISGSSGATIWMTGLSGSGKSTIAHEVERRLIDRGTLSYVLDGDNLRTGINADLGFSKTDRDENVRRVGEIARLMNDAGLVVLAPLISPFAEGRRRVRDVHERNGLLFVEVHVAASLEACERRDPKGLYRRARAGEIPDFTGIGHPYEPPARPEIRIDTEMQSLHDAAEELIDFLVGRLNDSASSNR